MAHQETPGAVDAPVTHTVDSAAAALSAAFQAEDSREEEAQPEDAADEFADDDFAEGEEVEGEQVEESAEPETPAIDAPISLTADEKAEFSQLPKEAQDYVTRLEQRRNQDVQKVTTKAAEAQRNAERLAANANTEAKQAYAQQLEQFVSAYAPQMPDPQQFGDLQSYNAAKAQYDYAKAQHDQIVQQVAQFGADAQSEAQQSFIQQRDKELLQIPEIANEETRKDYLDRAMGMASELGYDLNEISQGMVARDVKALAQVADWKDKAAKYDAAMSRKMTRVRAGKNRTLQPGAAQPQRSGNKAYTEAKQRLAKTGSVDDAAAAFKAIL